jgi:hypothetical protein
MQTITLKINNNSVLKTLEELESRHLISIIREEGIGTPALPGTPLSLEQFRNWINNAEQGPTISLKDADEKWAKRKQQLKDLMK